MLAIGGALATVFAQAVERRALDASVEETSLLAEAVIGSFLTRSDLNGLTTARARALDRQVRRAILPHRVAQVKVWNPDGKVVYSSAPGLTGKTFPLTDELRTALAGDIEAHVSDLEGAEHQGLAGLGEAYEIYVPLRIDGRLAGAFEIYRPFAPIAADIRAVQVRLYGVLAIGLLLLLAFLGRLVHRASRTLVTQSAELAVLYEQEHQALNRVRELDEMKTDIVAAVSHELRTPLTTIRGSLETMLGHPGAFDEAQRTELLEVAFRGSERLGALVDELLEVPRIYSGDLRVILQPLDIEDVLREASVHHRAVVHTVIPAKPPEVVSDHEVVRKVVEILVSNAVKFSPAGSPVTVRVRSSRGAVSIAVEDLGPGVPPGEEERIFEAFYQADHRPTRRVGGVGMGLHLARTLAGLVHGTIEVDRRWHKGARFVLKLERPARWTPAPAEIAGALRAFAS
jgi:signal transduction histidine kinase